jgi:leucyl/phenylalanyl-tRNA--protein transferase
MPVLRWLGRNDPFPEVDEAMHEPNGLLAAGGDLSPQRLIDAYRRGIFPWYNESDPILWWSPDPRLVLFPENLKVSRSLTKSLKKDYEIRTDSAFETVMRKCAEPRRDGAGTWISEEMISAYCALHEMGIAHSVETRVEGDLVGGLYGIALGKIFFGESMFSRRTDASKIAFVHLVLQLKRWGFYMIDCQVRTEHLASLGATEIPRSEFSSILMAETSRISAGKWVFDHDLVK